MVVAAQRRVEFIQVLLAGGADVEAKAANGKTAWQVAMGEVCGCCGRPGQGGDSRTRFVNRSSRKTLWTGGDDEVVDAVPR
jgi:hypothetical protein